MARAGVGLALLPTTHITVFTGRFGSGKTEISLNYAAYLAKHGHSTGQTITPLLVDLDLVTPYFRTRDKAEEMARRNVQVITPFSVGQHLHVPAISPQILGAIEQRSRPVVVDLGGDRQGARAMAPYAASIQHREQSTAPSVAQKTGRALRPYTYAMCFVLNPYRPDPNTGQALNAVDRKQAVRMIRATILEIEASARLRVTALVSNPNMLSESTPELFVAGHQIVQQAGQSIGLPIAFGVVSESFVNQPCFNKQLTKQLSFRLLSPPDGLCLSDEVYPHEPREQGGSVKKKLPAAVPRACADTDQTGYVRQMDDRAMPLLVLRRFFQT
jgi:hypothetical protein